MAGGALLYVLILFKINGLHSFAPRSGNSLGVLSVLLGKDSKSPLIVVIDTNKGFRSSDDELIRNGEYRDWDDKRSYEMNRNKDRNSYDDFPQKKCQNNVMRTDRNYEEDSQLLNRLINEALRSKSRSKFNPADLEMCSDEDPECKPKKKKTTTVKECKTTPACGPRNWTGKTCVPKW